MCTSWRPTRWRVPTACSSPRRSASTPSTSSRCSNYTVVRCTTPLAVCSERRESYDIDLAGGHHRIGQHRHRPDDQDPAQRRSPDRRRHGRHRPRLRRSGARRPHGVPTTADGVDGLLAVPNFGDIKVVFDATSATAHHANWAKLRDTGVRMLDLTPASIGPFCVPVVNLDDHLDAPNLNMVTCGGQATVPIVAAVAECGIVSYAEIVSSISARSAGPGTRANIDEFIETTSTALEIVGGAQRGKAVMILNPADPA